MKTMFYFWMGLLACRVTAFNSSPADALIAEDYEREASFPVAVGMNADALPVDPNQWIKIANYGEWTDGSPQKWRQVFQLEHAQEMAKAFNSVIGRAGRLLGGAPIYIGHPDQQPQIYTDHARIGKVVELDAREDGLYAKPAWNDKGLQNLEQGYHVYPSSTWYLRKQKLGETKVFPERFKSLGLTNFPAGDVEPVTLNADLPGSDATTENNNTDTMDPKLLKLVLAALNLEEGASADDVTAAIDSLKTAASNGDAEKDAAETSVRELTEAKETVDTELTEEKDKREAAENALTALKGEVASNAVAAAVSSGAITKAEVAGWNSRFETDHDGAMKALDAVSPNTALNTKSLDLGGSKPGAMNHHELTTVFNAKVEEKFEAGGRKNFQAAWNAVRALDEFEPLRREAVTDED